MSFRPQILRSRLYNTEKVEGRCAKAAEVVRAIGPGTQHELAMRAGNVETCSVISIALASRCYKSRPAVTGSGYAL